MLAGPVAERGPEVRGTRPTGQLLGAKGDSALERGGGSLELKQDQGVMGVPLTTEETVGSFLRAVPWSLPCASWALRPGPEGSASLQGPGRWGWWPGWRSRGPRSHWPGWAALMLAGPYPPVSQAVDSGWRCGRHQQGAPTVPTVCRLARFP